MAELRHGVDTSREEVVMFDQLREILTHNLDILTLALILIFAGISIGAANIELQQQVLEQAREIALPEDPGSICHEIFMNNIQLAILSLISGLLIVFVPTLLMSIAVLSVGSTFGAVMGLTGPGWPQIMFTFGLLELWAFILAVTSGLLYPKWILLRLFGKATTIGETVLSSAWLLFHSAIALLIAGILEALLIWSDFSSLVSTLGIVALIMYCYLLGGS